jgi:hypothetical protein
MSRESAEVAILKSYPSPASTMEDAGEEVIYVCFTVTSMYASLTVNRSSLKMVIVAIP